MPPRQSADLTRLDSVDSVEWEEFLAEHFELEPGQHVGAIGPNGQGKTTLVINLLELTPYTVAFGFKPKDETLDQLLARNRVGGGRYRRISAWVDRDPDLMPRRVLWPDMTSLDAPSQKRHIFKRALNEIYEDGCWTVYLDDLWFMAHEMGFDHEIKIYLTMFRALKGNLFVASQRPSWIPLEVFDQCTHLFFFRDNDETNLRRISGISFISAKLVRDIVAHLERFEFLYVNTRTGYMVRSRAPYVGPKR